MYIKNELLCLHGSSDFLIHISVRTVTDDCMRFVKLRKWELGKAAVSRNQLRSLLNLTKQN